MSWLKRMFGIVAFWLSWPLLFIYLKRGKRTRVLVICDDKILVVKGWHGYGDWALPGGGLHKGEDPKVGAVRELVEETGLIVKPTMLEVLMEGIQKSHGLSYRYICFWVRVDNLQPLRRQPLEILAAEWKLINDLNENNTSKDTLLYLQTWQKFAKLNKR